MSLFRKSKKKKKSKTPKITVNSDDYAFWKRNDSGSPQKKITSQQCQSVSSERLPILQPSPYGSFRDLTDSVSLPPMNLHQKKQAPDSRSVTSSLSYASGSHSGDFTDYSNSLSPPQSQRLFHYNRHKTLSKTTKNKKETSEKESSSQNPNDSAESVEKLPHNNNDESVSVNFGDNEPVHRDPVEQVARCSPPPLILSTETETVHNSTTEAVLSHNASTTISASQPSQESADTENLIASAEKVEHLTSSVNESIVQTFCHLSDIPAIDPAFTLVSSKAVSNLNEEQPDLKTDCKLEATDSESSSPQTVADDVSCTAVTSEPVPLSSVTAAIIERLKCAMNTEQTTLTVCLTKTEPAAQNCLESAKDSRQRDENESVCSMPSDMSAIEEPIILNTFAKSMSACPAELPSKKGPSEIAEASYHKEDHHVTSAEKLVCQEEESGFVLSEVITPAIHRGANEEKVSHSHASWLGMSQEKTDNLKSSSNEEGESPSQPLIKTTPSSSANLHGLELPVESREYRLSTEADADNEALLAPHTPVAADLNVSYPNSEHEDSEPVFPTSDAEVCETHLVDETKSLEEDTNIPSIVKTTKDVASDDTDPKVPEETMFGYIQNTVRNNWPAFTCAAVAAGIGAVILARVKYFPDS